jgi:hypothetical protein
MTLADLESLGPGSPGLGQSALSKIGPRVRHVDIAQGLAIAAVTPFENWLCELKRRQRFVELVHVRNQRRGERGYPPREFRGMLAILDRGARNGGAENRKDGGGIGFVLRLDALAQLRNRGLVVGRSHDARTRRRQHESRGARHCRHPERAGEGQHDGPPAHRRGARSISTTNAPSGGTGM